MDQDLRLYVLRRDGGCVGRFVGNKLDLMRWPMLVGLPDPGFCRDKWGNEIRPTDLERMTLDHNKDELGMAIREDDPYQLWTICPWAHLESKWVLKTEVKEAGRLYIAAANKIAIERGWPRFPVRT